MSRKAWMKSWEMDKFSFTVTYPPEGDTTTVLQVFGPLSESDLDLLEDCISETLRGEFVNPVAG